MSKRIAFVIPPFIGGRYFLQPPIGCLWTARLLSNNSIQSELYDLRLSKDPLSIIETLKTGFDYIVYDINQHIAVLSTINGDIKFIIIASKDDKKDEEVTTLLNQLSLLDKSISNDSFDQYMSKRFLECNCRLTLGVSLC